MFTNIIFRAMKPNRIGDQIICLPLIYELKNMINQDGTLIYHVEGIAKEIIKHFVFDGNVILVQEPSVINVLKKDFFTVDLDSLFENYKLPKNEYKSSIKQMWLPDKPFLTEYWKNLSLNEIIIKSYGISFKIKNIHSLSLSPLVEEIILFEDNKEDYVVIFPDAYIDYNRLTENLVAELIRILKFDFRKDVFISCSPQKAQYYKDTLFNVPIIYASLFKSQDKNKDKLIYGLEIDDFISFIGKAKIAIGGMTGLTHLAHLLTKTVYISYHPDDYMIFKPSFPDNVVHVFIEHRFGNKPDKDIIDGWKVEPITIDDIIFTVATYL